MGQLQYTMLRYKLASHFLPGFVFSQIRKHPATIIPTVKIAPNISINTSLF